MNETSNKPPGGFTLPEDALVKRLGVTRSFLREKRATGQPSAEARYLRGVHWELEHNRVLWSEEAVAELLQELGVAAPDVAKDSQEVEDDIEAVQVISNPTRRLVVRGRVVWGHFCNPNLIKARRENGEEVFVRVPDPSKFVTHLIGGEPMRFRARPQPGAWLMVDRAPRWRGKW